MVVLQRILVPTDFSETAGAALRHAESLAAAFGASIDVLHVLEDPLPGWKPAGHVAGVPKIRDGMVQEARNQLDKLLTEEQRNRLRAQFVMMWGKPFVEIVRYAKQYDIDLIVLGTHGRGPIGHMLMGSVAERVVRMAPCPVLTVRDPKHEFTMP